jgi:hypothetical protein
MFERFLQSFRVSPAGQAVGRPWSDARLTSAAGYRELAARLAGCSVEDGLYRFHDAASGPSAVRMIAEAFPEFAGPTAPFGYDWLGRQFALAGPQLVLLFEPGTGIALDVPASFASFHEQELVDHHDAALASEFFETWSAANPNALPLARDRCVGYRVPLFLGGSDAIENLEVDDRDVYWSMCAELRRGVSRLTPGSPIRGLEIED